MGIILLVRHGQASFGTEDYDRLSPLGVEQSRALGAALAQQKVSPRLLVTGRMRRHVQTASAIVEGAGWAQALSVDPAWDEFDVMSFLQDGLDGKKPSDSRAFQGDLEAAMRDWADNPAGHVRGETFASFTARVGAGLQRLAGRPDSSGLVIVSTSAGAIGWAVTSLLGGGVEQWIRLNRVCINASVTKIVVGRSGMSLVSFNEHGHLSGDDVSYR